jgi:cytochrome c oxidase cbb3-type subunit 4
MNPLWGNLAGSIIVLMMLTFVGTWIWLWNDHHKPTFDALARLPMNDDGDFDDADSRVSPNAKEQQP